MTDESDGTVTFSARIEVSLEDMVRIEMAESASLRQEVKRLRTRLDQYTAIERHLAANPGLIKQVANLCGVGEKFFGGGA